MGIDLFILRVRKLTGALAVPRFRRALRLGVLAAIDHVPALRQLQPEMVIDVGANRGQFALVARHLWPNARIVSFEPLPQAAALCKSVMHNDPQFVLFESAVGTTSGTSTINVTTADDSSSLLPLGDQHKELYGSSVAEQLQVRTEPLAGFIEATECPASTLLKIDTQGFELEVLKGSEQVLSCISHVYAELSFVELYTGQPLASEVIAYLYSRGYELVGVYNLASDRTGKPIQADMLFARRSSHQA